MPTPGVYERNRDDYRHPTFWRMQDNACSPHFHGALELTYVHSGALEAVIDGARVSAGPGDLVLVPGYAVHRFFTPESSDSTVLVIPTGYIRSFGELMREKRFSRTLLPACPTTGEIARCLELLLAHRGDGSGMWPPAGGESYLLRGQVYTVLGLLLERIPLEATGREADRGRVEEILHYLHGNYRQPLPLGAVAAALGYSESRLSHLFNGSVGCSVPEYLGALRARAAAAMLLEEDRSVTDIALEVGFGSMRTFYRTFQSSFGVTPARFRRLPQAELRALMQGAL